MNYRLTPKRFLQHLAVAYRKQKLSGSDVFAESDKRSFKGRKTLGKSSIPQLEKNKDESDKKESSASKQDLRAMSSDLAELEKRYNELLSNKYYAEFNKEKMEQLAEKIRLLKNKLLDISSH